jgi:hypothetical protein
VENRVDKAQLLVAPCSVVPFEKDSALDPNAQGFCLALFERLQLIESLYE